VAPQQSGGWQHNYSTKTRQAGHTNEQAVIIGTIFETRNDFNFNQAPLANISINETHLMKQVP
jgi:hypothetical protein